MMQISARRRVTHRDTLRDGLQQCVALFFFRTLAIAVTGDSSQVKKYGYFEDHFAFWDYIERCRTAGEPHGLFEVFDASSLLFCLCEKKQTF